MRGVPTFRHMKDSAGLTTPGVSVWGFKTQLIKNHFRQDLEPTSGGILLWDKGF